MVTASSASAHGPAHLDLRLRLIKVGTACAAGLDCEIIVVESHFRAGPGDGFIVLPCARRQAEQASPGQFGSCWALFRLQSGLISPDMKTARVLSVGNLVFIQLLLGFCKCWIWILPKLILSLTMNKYPTRNQPAMSGTWVGGLPKLFSCRPDFAHVTYLP